MSNTLGCADCGRPYSAGPDLVVSDADWKRIAPRPDGGGILCPNCMNDRFEKIGATAVSARFTSGPFALTSQLGGAERPVSQKLREENK